MNSKWSTLKTSEFSFGRFNDSSNDSYWETLGSVHDARFALSVAGLVLPKG
jgi:hypothetical protein